MKFSFTPLLLGIALVIARAASSELIDLGNVTHDTATGLDWLDVNQTLGLSFDDLQSGAGGWIAAGYRHASRAELCDVFDREVVDMEYCAQWGGAPLEEFDRLTRLLGPTIVELCDSYDCYYVPLTHGLTGDADTGYEACEGGHSSAYLFESWNWTFVPSTSCHADDDSDPVIGHFLVRVPEPGGKLQLAAGIAGLSLLALKRTWAQPAKRRR